MRTPEKIDADGMRDVDNIHFFSIRRKPFGTQKVLVFPKIVS